MGRKQVSIVLFLPLLLAIAILTACGGGSTGSSSSQMGFVNTVISDPAPCSLPSGPYSAVWITVTDVEIHNSSTGEWKDLTPGMAPTQVNLLNEPSTECFVAMLGSKTELDAGSYEQIRIHLADTNAHGVQLQTANACGSAGNAPLNCVVTGTGSSAVISPLLLSSEDKNGIKIPSGQIAGGSFTVAAGQTKDLDIDFSACASIVVQGNGQYRLKPVLHAGEVGLNSAVNGKVVDADNNNASIDGTVLVLLEQRKGNTDRVFLSTRADANGNFALCPAPDDGTYDLVAAAISNSGLVYATTVLTGVKAGTVVGNVPLYQEKTANTGTATISGNVSTVGSGEDVLVSALQQVNDGVNPPFMVTVPSVSPVGATFTLTTQDSPTCSGALCTFSLGLPGVNPAVGVFGSALSYTQSSGATYKADALTLPSDTPVCSQTEVQSNPFTLNPGDSQTNVGLAFTGCTPPPSTP